MTWYIFHGWKYLTLNSPLHIVRSNSCLSWLETVGTVGVNKIFHEKDIDFLGSWKLSLPDSYSLPGFAPELHWNQFLTMFVLSSLHCFFFLFLTQWTQENTKHCEKTCISFKNSVSCLFLPSSRLFSYLPWTFSMWPSVHRISPQYFTNTPNSSLGKNCLSHLSCWYPY